MKNTLLALLGFFLLSTPLAVTAEQSGDFTYTSDGFTATITGYYGTGGAVIIPPVVWDDFPLVWLPVRGIGNYAFNLQRAGNDAIGSVTIPAGVYSIGIAAFSSCTSLAAITVDAANPVLRSLNGVLFDKGLTKLIAFPGGQAGNYPIPGSVIIIQDFAFLDCTSLTSVTIPGSVSYIGFNAFNDC